MIDNYYGMALIGFFGMCFIGFLYIVRAKGGISVLLDEKEVSDRLVAIKMLHVACIVTQWTWHCTVLCYVTHIGDGMCANVGDEGATGELNWNIAFPLGNLEIVTRSSRSM